MAKELYKYRIAVATSDGIVVNQHFGRATNFKIYGIKQDNTPNFLEDRSFDPVCQAGNHDEARMEESAARLSDCKYVVISRIGQGAVNALSKEGVIAMELPGIIEESIHRLVVYEEVQSLLE